MHELGSAALDAAAATDFATPGRIVLEPSARIERAASHVPGECSAHLSYDGLVPVEGLEPPWMTPTVSEAVASTNFRHTGR